MKWANLKTALRTATEEPGKTNGLVKDAPGADGKPDTLKPASTPDISVRKHPPPGAAAATPQDERSRDRSLCKALMASMYDALLILDEKGNVIASNPRAELFFGYDEATLWGMSAFKLIAGFNPVILNKIRAYVADDRFTVLNTKGMKQDGGTFAAEIAFGSIFYLHEDDLLLTIRNVDRRQKAERKLALERDTAAYSAIPLLLIDEAFTIQYANTAAAEDLTGNPETSLVDQSLSTFVKDTQALQNACTKAANADTARWAGPLPLKGPRGKPRSVNATLRHLPPQRGDQTLFVLAFTP